MKTFAFVLVAAAIAACDRVADTGDPSFDPSVAGPPAEFDGATEHPYFPLRPGTRWAYAGTDEGRPRREEVEVLPGTRAILGVPCVAVRERVFLDGAPTESTTHWYAVDVQGNVWRFGEESIEFRDGLAVRSEDSWEAGVEGASAWVALPARLEVGDEIVGRGAGAERVVVLALDAAVVVPAGAFEGCLALLETNPEDPEDEDEILYAAGVGRVHERSPEGESALVEMVPGR